MLNIQNKSMEEIIEESSKMIAMGAGALFEFMVDSYREDSILDKLCAIIDNNTMLSGTYRNLYGKDIPIYTPDEIDLALVQGSTLVITPVYFTDMIAQLDTCQKFDQVETYIYTLATACGNRGSFSLRSKAEERIPRKIHYCWFGDEMPEELQKNVREWYKLCPDYEIIKWDESNYDISKNQYMREAYEKKCYAFVSDYARKDIIYNHGGIYLDTDVKLLRRPDDLLYNEFFLGMDDAANINSGGGFGAVRYNALLKQFVDDYNRIQFIREDGSMNQQPCGVYETRIAIRNGFKQKNKYQMLGDTVIFPREVFMPQSWMGLPDHYTEKTCSVHQFSHIVGGVTVEERKEQLQPVLDRIGYGSGKPYKIGYAPGVYDLFHIGHLNLLRRARELSEYLIVGVLSDELVKHFKQSYPYIPMEERMEIIRALKCVDEVVEVNFSNTVKMDAWKLYHYDAYFSGSDHGSEWDQEKRELQAVGSDIVFLPYTMSTSSTQIKQAMGGGFLPGGVWRQGMRPARLYLFGAGRIGQGILKRLEETGRGRWKVEGFLDNATEKHLTRVEGVVVYRVEDLKRLETDGDYKIYLALKESACVREQLVKEGLGDHLIKEERELFQ